MNYRNFDDLFRTLWAQAERLPIDLDLIVGVPRSGLIPAAAIALQRNLPLTDLDGLVAGRLFSTGRRGDATPISDPLRAGAHILVVDDSIASGSEMRRTRAFLEKQRLPHRFTLAAVYTAPDAPEVADLALEICPTPRMFAWNLMHSVQLRGACVDIDGVLCRDPTDQENDDGPRYREFLRSADPLHIPTFPVGTLVTARLEKYREPTVGWLRRYGVEFGELVMWDLPDGAERRRRGTHGEYKASVYRARSESGIFLESSARQAQVIANSACKPVICVPTLELHEPMLRPLVRGTVRKLPRAARRRLAAWKKGLVRLLLRWNRY